MVKCFPGFFVFFLVAILFSYCNPKENDIDTVYTDSVSISIGSNIFNQNCSSCHNFRQDGIGPQLSGLTKRDSIGWIKKFVRDPKSMIASGDAKAVALYAKYRTTMPAFDSLTNRDMDRLISFIYTHRNDITSAGNKTPSNRSILPHIIPSTLSIGLQMLTQIPPSSKKSPMARIVKMDYIPKAGSLFINDLRGKLYGIRGNKATVYLDLKKERADFIDQPGLATGFGSFAFHPDFVKNGLFYSTHTEPAATKVADFKYADSIKPALQWVLTEWKARDPRALTFSGSSREVLRIDMISQIHGIQNISFNPFTKKNDKDYGKLFIGIGDGGTVENGHPEYVHQLNKIWGTILRIDPTGRNSLNGQYGIPADNPFVKNNAALREIYAYGFRNPNQFSWSSPHSLFASNIGQANIEAINIILPGHDYGWPLREGNFVLNPKDNLSNVYDNLGKDSLDITYPVVQYDHSEGKAIAGGFAYLGKLLNPLIGKYIFGDIVSGRVFYVDIAGLKPGKPGVIREAILTINGERINLKDICGSDRVDLRFGRDMAGEMYLFTKSDGKIYKFVNK